MHETNIHSLYASKQTSRGTLSTAGTRRFILPGGGDLRTVPAHAAIPFSDLEKFGDAIDVLDSLTGQGDPVLEGTPEELAYLLWLFTGAETTSAVVGPPAKTRHSFVPGNGFFWSSWHIRKGRTEILRHLFGDTRVSQLVIAASFGQKDLRVTPTLLSLDPGVVKTADPATVIPAKNPFFHTESTGRFEVDGVPFEGVSGYTLTLNEDLQLDYGDSETPLDARPGNATVGISVSCYLDADGIAQFNKLLYGTPTPAADAKPLRGIPALGSFEAHHKARDAAGAVNGDEFHPEIPGVKWDVPETPPPNPAGGAAELTLTGSMRKVAGQPAWKADVDCDAAAFTT